ncbi:MAG: ribose-phosphate diphosphokinase [Candidatus Gracilibacteria bacterium]|nr:ribose-phosphate diphosphokinase [Candidatus Gracilibacteria bacterium]
MKTIISHPNFEYLALDIANNNKGKINKADISMETFPDSWPNIFINDVKDLIEHQEVTYIGDFSKPEDLFINFSAIRGILDYYADKVRVILPYFPVGTMERIETKGEIATAKYFADIMSLLPSGREAKTSIHIFDIHALVERFLFDSRQVNAEIHTAMSILKNEIEGKTIVFPDDGAKKRFGKDFSDFDTIVCSKVRIGNERQIQIKEGNPNGKDLIIIDDLIQTGGTIKETANKLRELGAKSVSAYATHGVFPNDSHIYLAKNLDKLIVTDSIPINIKRAENIVNMQVISIKPLIEKIIFRE